MDYTHLRQLTEVSDLEKAGRSKSLLLFENVRKAVLLFDVEDYEGVAPFISQLEKAGKHVRAWSFSPSYDPAKDKAIDRSYRMFVMNCHHFDRKGQPLKWVNVDFHSWDAELLIDLSRRDNPVMEYFASVSGAVFKIGLKSTAVQRYELVCDVSHAQGDIRTFASQLMMYYRSLRGNGDGGNGDGPAFPTFQR